MTKRITQSVRVDTITHYRLTNLARDTNTSLAVLIKQAVQNTYFNSSTSQAVIPVEDVLAFVSKYKSTPAAAPALPDWLEG